MRIFFRGGVRCPRPDALGRALGMVIDGVIVNLSFTALAAAFALIENAFGGDGAPSSITVVVGSTAWVTIGSLYLIVFWSLAGRTPGMSFVGIRLSEKLSLRRALRRLLGLVLSVFAFGIGFLGVLFREDRREWADRLAGVDVVYDEWRPEPAPWSRPPAASVAGAAGGEQPLHPEGGGAGQDQQRDVDGENRQGAERFVGAGGAERDS